MTTRNPHTFTRTIAGVVIAIAIGMLLYPAQADAQDFVSNIVRAIQTGDPAAARPPRGQQQDNRNEWRPQTTSAWQAPKSTRDIIRSVPALRCSDRMIQLTKRSGLPFGLGFTSETRRNRQMRSSARSPERTAERTISHAWRIQSTAKSCRRQIERMAR